MAKRRAEPLVWLLFSSGGLAAALLLPVLLALFGLVIPAGWVSAPTQAHLLSLAAIPVTFLLIRRRELARAVATATQQEAPVSVPAN